MKLSAEPPLDVDAVYRERADFVWKNLRRFGVPPHLVEDAMHDVFVVIHRRAAHFDPSKASITTWVFGIVRRVAADVRRGDHRRKRRVDAYRDHHDQTDRDRQQQRPPAELRVMLANMLGSVDEQAAQIFVLSQLHGVPLWEIADDLGINRNTAASRLRATRRRFSELTAAQDEVHREVPVAIATLVELERDEPGTMPEPARVRVLAGLLPVWSTTAPAYGVALAVVLALMVLVCASLALRLATAIPARVEGPAVPNVQRQLETRAAVVRPPTLILPDIRPEPSNTSITVPTIERGEPPRAAGRARRRPATPGQHPTAPLSEKTTADDPSAAPPGLSPGSTLAEELSLISQARRAVRTGKPTRALTLIQVYGRRFPKGALHSEMAVVEIDSLCRLGRTDDARRRIKAMPAITAPAGRDGDPCG